MSVSSSRGLRLTAAAGPGRHKQRGYVLIMTSLMLLFVVIPAAGLAIDAALMYLVQTRLSAASDAAALAGARALSRGSNDPAQSANAQSVATTYFNANFPAGYFFSTNLQVTSVAGTDSTYIRSVTTSASVDLPLLFMRMFGKNSSVITASAKATRRDVNVMVVMDRSESLDSSGACQPLKAAAISFVDKFAENRDNLGLVTFATGSRVDYAISTTFKTSVQTTLQNLVCDGFTNSSQALWQGYKQLVALKQPGAMNVIVFFTDGRPTAFTANFPLRSAGRTCSSSGPLLGVLTNLYYGNNNVPVIALGLYRPDAPAQPLSSDMVVMSGSNGCRFASQQWDVTQDVDRAPTTDRYGTSLSATGYRSVTAYGGGYSIATPQDIEDMAVNATDHAALRIRRGDPDPLNGNLSLSNTVIFSIGLGDVDETLLRRVANDPSIAANSSTAGAQGMYVYAQNVADLNQAFNRVASEILRLAK